MVFDYGRLMTRINDKFENNSNFAKHMQLSERTISLKLNNKIDFKQKEIVRACNLLGIPLSQVYEYFYTLYIQ